MKVVTFLFYGIIIVALSQLPCSIRAAQSSSMFTHRNIYVTVMLANTLFCLCCGQILYLRKEVGDALGVFLKEEKQKQHSQISL